MSIVVYMCFLIFVYLYLSLSISIYLYLSLSISIYLYLPISLSLCLSVCPSIHLSIDTPSIHLSNLIWSNKIFSDLIYLSNLSIYFLWARLFHWKSLVPPILQPPSRRLVGPLHGSQLVVPAQALPGTSAPWGSEVPCCQSPICWCWT